jgi:hypothetical protein
VNLPIRPIVVVVAGGHLFEEEDRGGSHQGVPG